MVKYELQKLFTNKLFIPIIIAILFLWAFILFNSSPTIILSKSLTFWNILGSLILGFIILMINTRIFSLDIDEQVEEVFKTTKLGKRRLFIDRLKATAIFSAITVLIFAGIQIGLTFLFATGEQALVIPYTMPVSTYFIMQILIVMLGAISFAFFTACLCDSFKSQTITLISCGLLYGFSYILRTPLINNYSILWFLDRGFFSFITRGKIITIATIDLYEILFMVLWYVILIYLMILVNKKMRLRRKEV